MKTKSIGMLLMLSLIVGVYSPISWAGDRQHHSYGAHIHGLAELTIALEGNRLEIHLTSPASNIVGFEHRAVTSAQQQAVEKAKKVLESPEKLFAFKGANCRLETVTVDMAAVKSADKEHHGHHHEHGHEHHHNDSHSEISANYHFDCKQGIELSSISVRLLSQFPGIETMNAMWVTDNLQGSVELSANKNDIHLR